MNKNFLKLFGIIILLLSCSSPKQLFIPKINDRLSADLNNNAISIITYNIQTVFGKGEEKVESLINYLNSANFDFVAMQEVFDENTRTNLVNRLNPISYKAVIPRVDYDSFPSNICQDAGLFTASRYPIIDLSKYDFGEDTEFSNGAIHQMLAKEFSISLDFMANKSILGSLHQLNDSTQLFLFTTHLQAISSRFHKTFQLGQIYSFIVNSVSTVLKNNVTEFSENLIVLLTGDLNYNAYSEGDVETLKNYLGEPRDLHKEYNGAFEEYTMTSKLLGFYRRVDYIFAYDNIGLISLRKVGATSINVTDIIDGNNSSLSDHLALKATIVF